MRIPLLLPLLALATTLACTHSARADDDASKLYDLSFDAPSKVAKGGQGTVKVKIVPHKGADVNKQAPLSLALSAPESIALSKAKLGKADVKFEGENASFEVPFAANQAGKASIDATVKFYICTEKTCTPQERKATMPVTVQ